MFRGPTNRTARRPLSLTRLEDRTAPAIVTWDGGGADNKWSTPANWVGDVPPQAGDDVVFPSAAVQPTNINDFPADTVFHSIAVTGAGYQVSGSAINVSAGVTADIAADGTSTLSLAIGGQGGLTKTGAGTLVLLGANSYDGVTAVTAGILQIRSDTALGAIGAGNETTVTDGGTLQLYGNNPDTFTGMTVAEPVFFSGRGAGELGAIANLFPGNTLSGPLTLTGNGLITARAGRLTITAGIGEVGGPRDLELRNIAVADTIATFTSTAVNTYTGTTAVFGIDARGAVQFDGHGVSPMVLRGSLKGSGTVGPVRTVDNLSYIIPGDYNHAGTLTMGGLDFEAGVLPLDVRPDGVDRLDVNGPVTLGGTARPDFNFDFQFVPTPGARYTLIANDDTDPVQGTFPARPEGSIVTTILETALRITYHGGDGNDVELFTTPAESLRRFAVGAGPGTEPRVKVYGASGELVRSFLAYDASFRGGVRVATADLTGDAVPDVITAPGPGGGPHVKVFDGATGAIVREFMAYDPLFRGGVFVATARINLADSIPDIITGAGAGGGPHVEVFNGATGALFSSFMAYDPGFRGGVSVAGADYNVVPPRGVINLYYLPGNVVTGAGPGGGPHVKVFGFQDNGPAFFTGLEFMAYDAAFRGGINVTVPNGNNVSAFGPVRSAYDPFTVVTAPESGAGPDVRLFTVRLMYNPFFFTPPPPAIEPAGTFQAYAPGFHGGVTVAALPIGPKGAIDYVTGTGPGGGPHVRRWRLVLDPQTANYVWTVASEFMAFAPSFTGGVYVG